MRLSLPILVCLYSTLAFSAGPATHFSVSAPASATTGTAFNVTVTALDASNATATTYAGTVHFTSTDTAATLPANSTLTNGVGTLAVTLRTAGNQAITATDTVNASITGTSGPIATALNFTPNGNLGTIDLGPNTFFFTPVGGSGNYTFSYAPAAAAIPNFRIFNAPELPSNASASQLGGLTGIPLTTGLKSTTIRLTDNTTGAFVDRAISFTVSPLDVIGFGPFYYSIGDTVSQRFWPTGGTPPYNYALTSGTLPPGLSLGTQVVNGVSVALVSGTINNTANTATTTATNQYNFTITITDSAANSIGRGYSMAVSAMQLQVNGTPLNAGTNRILPPATINLAYSQQIAVGGGTAPYTFTMETGSAAPSTITLSSTGLLSGTPTSTNFSGRFTFDVTDAANHFMSVRVALRILPTTPSPLSLNTNLIGDGSVGDNADWEISAGGGLPPYTFDIDPATPLPAGAVLIQGLERDPRGSDPDPCYIRTRIQTAGAYTFNVRVTDSAGNRASRPYTLNIRTLSPNAPINGTLGVPYSVWLLPKGGTPPYTVTPFNIPAGLTIDNNGHLFGTPQEAGSFLPLIYDLADSAGSHYTNNSQNINLIASSTSPGLTLSGGDFGVTRVGVQFASNLTAGNSVQTPPVFTVSLVSGTIPPGLRLLTGSEFNNGGATNIAAQLAGIPTTPGNYTFVYRVVDGLGQVGQRQIKLRVSGMDIVNTGINPGTVGVPYLQTFDLRRGTPPYTFSLTTGNLPNGLLFNTTNGTISGTPTTSASVTIGIQVQDNAGDLLIRSYGLNIYPIQLTGPDVLPDGSFGVNYSYTFTPSPAGSYSFTVTGQQAGLSIDSSTGVLSGIPTGTGTFNIGVTAFNNATGAIAVRTFTMYIPPQQGLINGLPTGEITVGGVPTSYLGAATAGVNTVFTLGYTGGTAPFTVALVPPSTLPPGMTLAIGSTYQGTTNFDRWVIAGVPTTPGVYTFKLRYSDSLGVSEDRILALNVITFGLATANPGLGRVNQPYSAQLYGAGGSGSYTFALSSEVANNIMPPGLTLSPSGLVSGTPTSTGAFTTNIDVGNGGSTRRVGVNFTINATTDNRRVDLGLGPLLGDFAAGRAAIFPLSPFGGAGTHTWSLVSGALPPGMQLFTNSSLPPGFAAPGALIAGAPTTPGTYNFRIRVDDSTGNFGIRDASINVTPFRFTPANNPYTLSTSVLAAHQGSPYSFTLGILNGRAPLAFTTEPGTLLPAGLTFSSAGVLSGTPTESGNFFLIAHITDADGNIDHFSTGITVWPSNKPVGLNAGVGAGTVLPSGTVNASYSLTLNDLLSGGTTGTPPYTWTVHDGALPPGLAIVPGVGLTSATLSGTPTAVGTYTFSFNATDVNGKSPLLRLLQLTVSLIGVSPPPGALPPAIAGVAYQTTVTGSGGAPPYAFAKSYDSDMPSGLSLSPNGILSGTALFAGPYVIFVNATDSLGNTFRQRYTLNVSPVGTVSPAFTLSPASISLTYTIGDAAPPPIPISAASTATPLAYTDSASSSGWLSLTSAGGTTPGAPNAIINPAGLSAATYIGTLSFTSAGASNSPATIPVTLKVNNAVVCTYALFPTAGTISASGGGGSFSVTAPASCNWSVDTASLPNWITIAPPANGTGSGPVNFTVSNNPDPTSRSTTINVNGVSYTITQFGISCSFTILPQTIPMIAAGGTGPIQINASSAGCTWNVTPISPFISNLSAPSGRGSKAITISVAANASPSSRSGTIIIAGQTLTVNQAGVGCTFSLSSTGTSVSSAGGAVSFDVTVPAGCTWVADTGPSWISPVSGASGNGNGTVSLSVAPNSTTNGRSANVQAGGQFFQVTQAGVPCSFSLSANNPVQPAGGGNGSVNITTSNGCNWTASSSAPWTSLGSNNGAGAGTLNFAVASNGTGQTRNAMLTIVGQNITVNQNGPVCTYTLQSTSATVPGAGASGTVGVNTAAGCGPWTAASNTPSWLHITGSASFNGPNSAAYTSDANLSGADRFGSLTIAGQPFTVTQPALPCSVTLVTPSPANVGEFGGNAQFTYTVSPSGCVVTPQSNSSWLTLTDISVPGTAQYAVAANTYAATRSGSIVVGDKSFIVNQTPSTCAYTLTSFAATFGQAGGSNGTVPMNFSPLACGPPPVIVNGPAGMVSLTGVNAPGAGMYAENYAVSLYLSFISYVRTTQLVINGQIFTVKQTSW